MGLRKLAALEQRYNCIPQHLRDWAMNTPDEEAPRYCAHCDQWIEGGTEPEGCRDLECPILYGRTK